MASRKFILQVDLHVRFEHVIPFRHSNDEFGGDDILRQRRAQAQSLFPTKSHAEVLHRLLRLLHRGGGGVCSGGDGGDYRIRVIRRAFVQSESER